MLPPNSLVAESRLAREPTWVLAKLRERLAGKVAGQLHTGKVRGHSLIPSAWGKDLVGKLPNSMVVRAACSARPPARRRKAVAWPLRPMAGAFPST